MKKYININNKGLIIVYIFGIINIVITTIALILLHSIFSLYNILENDSFIFALSLIFIVIAILAVFQYIHYVIYQNYVLKSINLIKDDLFTKLNNEDYLNIDPINYLKEYKNKLDTLRYNVFLPKYFRGYYIIQLISLLALLIYINYMFGILSIFILTIYYIISKSQLEYLFKIEEIEPTIEEDEYELDEFITDSDIIKNNKYIITQGIKDIKKRYEDNRENYQNKLLKTFNFIILSIIIIIGLLVILGLGISILDRYTSIFIQEFNIGNLFASILIIIFTIYIYFQIIYNQIKIKQIINDEL